MVLKIVRELVAWSWSLSQAVCIGRVMPVAAVSLTPGVEGRRASIGRRKYVDDHLSAPPLFGPKGIVDEEDALPGHSSPRGLFQSFHFALYFYVAKVHF